MCLTHSPGIGNFWFIEPGQKLHGTCFSYSAQGFILLQFVIEHGRTAQRPRRASWQKALRAQIRQYR